MYHWKRKPRWDWRWYFRRDIHGNMVEADKYAVIAYIMAWMLVIVVVGFS